MRAMAHTPINHPLRPFYRVLSGLIGLYVLIFGIVGYAQTSNLPFVGRQGDWVLGLRTNPAFSVLSIIGGAALLIAAVVGRNVFAYVNLAAAAIFAVTGVGMMLLLQTSANILAFSMATVIASLVFSMVVMMAGMYGKVGSRDAAHAEDVYRH